MKTGVVSMIESFTSTFHYGSIKILKKESNDNTLTDLHSTMVLLKFVVFKQILNVEVKSTFHYGSIKIY